MLLFKVMILKNFILIIFSRSEGFYFVKQNGLLDFFLNLPFFFLIQEFGT